MNNSRAEREKRDREGARTHGPELHAWPSPCAVPVNGDLSERAREGDGAGGKEESGGWFTGRRLALEN